MLDSGGVQPSLERVRRVVELRAQLPRLALRALELCGERLAERVELGMLLDESRLFAVQLVALGFEQLRLKVQLLAPVWGLLFFIAQFEKVAAEEAELRAAFLQLRVEARLLLVPLFALAARLLHALVVGVPFFADGLDGAAGLFDLFARLLVAVYRLFLFFEKFGVMFL